MRSSTSFSSTVPFCPYFFFLPFRGRALIALIKGTKGLGRWESSIQSAPRGQSPINPGTTSMKNVRTRWMGQAWPHLPFCPVPRLEATIAIDPLDAMRPGCLGDHWDQVHLSRDRGENSRFDSNKNDLFVLRM